MGWEFGISRHKPSYTRWINDRVLLNNTENYIQYSVINHNRKEYEKEYMCLAAQLCLTLGNPMDYSPPGSSVHGDSPDKNTGVGCHYLPSRGFSQPRDLTQADSLLSEPSGKSIYVCVLIHIYVCVCVCVCINESLCYTSEANTLQILYTSIK